MVFNKGFKLIDTIDSNITDSVHNEIFNKEDIKKIEVKRTLRRIGTLKDGPNLIGKLFKMDDFKNMAEVNRRKSVS